MPCSGTPDPCMYHWEDACEPCGCDWDWEWEECSGIAIICSSWGTQVNCERCGCIWEEVGTNIKINIADTWRDVDGIKINIGDLWKTVTEIWINIGDVWKRVF